MLRATLALHSLSPGQRQPILGWTLRSPSVVASVQVAPITRRFRHNDYSPYDNRPQLKRNTKHFERDEFTPPVHHQNRSRFKNDVGTPADFRTRRPQFGVDTDWKYAKDIQDTRPWSSPSSLQLTTRIKRCQDMEELAAVIEDNVESINLFHVGSCLAQMEKLCGRTNDYVGDQLWWKVLIQKFLSANVDLSKNPELESPLVHSFMRYSRAYGRRAWNANEVERKAVVEKVVSQVKEFWNPLSLPMTLSSAAFLHIEPASILPDFWAFVEEDLLLKIPTMKPLSISNCFSSIAKLGRMNHFGPEFKAVLDKRLTELFKSGEFGPLLISDIAYALFISKLGLSKELWQALDYHVTVNLKSMEPRFTYNVLKLYGAAGKTPSTNFLVELHISLDAALRELSENPNHKLLCYVENCIAIANNFEGFRYLRSQEQDMRSTLVFRASSPEALLQEISLIQTSTLKPEALSALEEKVYTMQKALSPAQLVSAYRSLGHLHTSLEDRARIQDNLRDSILAALPNMNFSTFDALIGCLTEYTDQTLQGAIEETAATLLPNLLQSEFSWMIRTLARNNLRCGTPRFWAAAEAKFVEVALLQAPGHVARDFVSVDKIGLWTAERAVTPTFLKAMKEYVNSLSPTDTTSFLSMFHSQTTVGPPELFLDRVQEIFKHSSELESLDGFNFSKLLWVSSRYLTFLSPEQGTAIEAKILSLILPGPEQDGQYNLPSTLWALTKMDYAPSLDFLEACEPFLVQRMKMDKMNPKDFKYVVSSLGRLSYSCGAGFWETFDEKFIEILPQMKPYDISSCARVLSNQRRDNSRLYKSLQAFVEKHPGLLSTQSGPVLKQALEDMGINSTRYA